MQLEMIKARLCKMLGTSLHEKAASFMAVTSEQTEACVSAAERRTIQYDSQRTRADDSFFAKPATRYLLRIALLRYCAHNKIQYMQGINEIMAPLLCLGGDGHNNDCDMHPVDQVGEKALESSFSISFVLFERLVGRLAPVLFNEGVQGLQSQLASLHLLLYFHDAELATFLSSISMGTDVYAQGWFVTLFARRAPVGLALHVWDLLLSSPEKPHIVVFLGLALLLHSKHKLLCEIPRELIPETLVRLCLDREGGTEEIDAIFSRALVLEQRTPTSFVGQIRRVGFDANISEIGRAALLYDLMYLPCVTVTAQDMADSLLQPSPTESAPAKRYLILDCSPDGKIIEGSLHVSPGVVDEICESVDNQLAAGENDSSSPLNHPVLAALWTCRAENVFLVLCGGADTVARPPLTSFQANADPVSAIRHLKRQLAKRANLLPFNQLAVALLVLGFSRVSVVRGEGDEMSSSGRDALVRELIARGATISGGVLRGVPQDAELTSKLYALPHTPSKSSLIRLVESTLSRISSFVTKS